MKIISLSLCVILVIGLFSMLYMSSYEQYMSYDMGCNYVRKVERLPYGQFNYVTTNVGETCNKLKRKYGVQASNIHYTSNKSTCTSREYLPIGTELEIEPNSECMFMTSPKATTCEHLADAYNTSLKNIQ